MGAVQEIGRGAPRIRPDGGPEAEEHERQVLHPTGVARGAGAGDQAVLEGPVLPLYHAVALRVIGGGELGRDPQAARELDPKIAGELSSTVRDYRLRRTKAGNPMAQ